MYNKKLIACIKADGKILREQGENVYLPFGTEYQIFLKNENDRKVEISITIDGEDVLNGSKLLLSPGKNMELKGFIRDINGGEDNRAFKFIEKTQEISEFRGDKPEDGLVKITYQFEQESITNKLRDFWYSDDRIYTNHTNPSFGPGFIETSTTPTYGTTSISSNEVFCSTEMVSNNISTNALRNNDMGITVEGTATNQKFQEGNIGYLENETHSIILKLVGVNGNEKISEPITVKTKKQCPSCGRKYKSSFQYCPQDGTYLR